MKILSQWPSYCCTPGHAQQATPGWRRRGVTSCTLMETQLIITKGEALEGHTEMHTLPLVATCNLKYMPSHSTADHSMLILRPRQACILSHAELTYVGAQDGPLWSGEAPMGNRTDCSAAASQVFQLMATAGFILVLSTLTVSIL